MAANLYTHQSGNVAKTWLIMSMFFVLIMFIGWFASVYTQDVSILYIAVFVSIAMNIASYWWSDKIVLSMTGAKPASKETHYELYTLVENLAITAGLPMPKVYVIDDPVPNAFATGRNKEHAVVAFTTGLLRTLNRTELEGVAAHELAHIGNRDILLQTVIVVLVGFVTLLSDMLLRVSMTGQGGDRERSNQLQLILMVAGFILALLAPLVATLMQLAVSRKREFLADATGAMLTRYPEGLASALEKISAQSGEMRRANHATAHLFISDPFGARKGRERISFLHKIFLTHPPVHERVAALRGTR